MLASSSLITDFLGQLFPPRCSECGQWGAAGLCSQCWSCCPPEFRYLPSGLAGGLPVLAGGAYIGGLRRAILNFKQNGSGEVAEQLGRQLARRLLLIRPEWVRAHPIVVPIPASPGRSRRRGHRPVQMLAQGIARSLCLPLASEALVLVGDPAPRKQLDQDHRLAATDLCFQLAPRCRGYHSESVLLVDDVVTTGQTLLKAAATLRNGGYRNIAAITVALVPRNAKAA